MSGEHFGREIDGLFKGLRPLAFALVGLVAVAGLGTLLGWLVRGGCA